MVSFVFVSTFKQIGREVDVPDHFDDVMAKTELVDAASRGQKRLRPENQSLESTPVPEVSRKRRRLEADQPQSFVGRVFSGVVGKAVGFWNYFWGKSSREDPADMDDPVDDEVR